MIRKVDAYKEEAGRELREARERAGIGSITGELDRLFGKVQKANRRFEKDGEHEKRKNLNGGSDAAKD
jgi:hypothetical protein